MPDVPQVGLYTERFHAGDGNARNAEYPALDGPKTAAR